MATKNPLGLPGGKIASETDLRMAIAEIGMSQAVFRQLF